MRSFFGNRFIRAILMSALFLQLGIWVRNFAILLFVAEQTNKDPVAISLISVAEFAPIFVFSFIGGAFADRWRPKRTMVLSDFLSALSVFAVLVALIFGGWKAIFFATLISSILSQFSQPAGMKLIKQHVPEAQLQISLSMYQTIQAVFMILGPMLGTLVFYRFGIEAAIAIVGVCFLISASVLLSLPRDSKSQNIASDSLMVDLKLGLRYVMANKIFLQMGGFFLAAGLGLGIINPLGVFLVTEHLGLKEEHLQWFTASNGVGMILGGMLVMGLSQKISSQSMLVAGFVLNSFAVAALGTVKLTALAMSATFLSGLMVPFIHIACGTMIMKRAEQAYVGRVNGILNPLFMGGMLLTMSLVGILKTVFPLDTLYLLSAGLFFIGGLASFPLLRYRSTKGDTPNNMAA